MPQKINIATFVQVDHVNLLQGNLRIVLLQWFFTPKLRR